MFKQALRSYITSLHPRNYKKIKDPFGAFFWLYWLYGLIVEPVLSGYEETGDTIFKIVFYITKLIPFFIMWWSNLGHRLSMQKMMYLLPMREKDKKEYFNALLAVKIGFPVAVSIVLHIIQGIIYEMDWLVIFVCTFATLSFGIGMYVCSELRSKFDRYIRYAVRGKDGTGKDAWLNWTCMICSVVVMLFFSMCERTGGEGDFQYWIFAIAVVSILVIMNIAIIKTRYEATIADVCNYEKNFNILGKVKK